MKRNHIHLKTQNKISNTVHFISVAKVLEHESTSSKKRKRESVASGTTSKRKKPSAESTPKMCRTMHSLLWDVQHYGLSARHCKCPYRSPAHILSTT